MGLFKKKKEVAKEQTKKEFSKLPELPELPKLPEFSEMEESKTEIHKLPKFPKNSFGEKFSRDTIKEAVTGGKEGEEVFADEFVKKEKQMVQKPLPKKQPPITKPPKAPKPLPSKRIIRPYEMRESYPVRVTEEKRPLFVRIDKVEEGIKSLQEINKLISEIREMLQDLKRIKDEEEKELLSWEEQIQNAKIEVENIEKNIFSRIGE